MNNDEDTGEDALSRIDLHTWRVPPPSAGSHAAILLRALSPAISPKRARLGWLFAALVAANVVLAALLVIVLSQSPSQTTTVKVLPAGGPIEAQTRAVLHRLEQEERELELKVSE